MERFIRLLSITHFLLADSGNTIHMVFGCVLDYNMQDGQRMIRGYDGQNQLETKSCYLAVVFVHFPVVLDMDT